MNATSESRRFRRRSQSRRSRRPELPAAQFPPDFVWGAASSPSRSEGETVSDWHGLSAPDGSAPDDGPGHWRRYRRDFRALTTLGFSAYRFGCDWGRLQAAPFAPLNREEMYRYLEMLAELRGMGVDPWLVLFQDALPRWAAADGGWLHPDTPRRFADFAARLADATDGEVANWVTVHEPQLHALSRYAWGAPPGGSTGRLAKALKALANLKAGHRLAAEALRRRLPLARVGLSLPGVSFLPSRSWHMGDRLAAWCADWAVNRAELSGFAEGGGACDFLMLGAGGRLRVTAGDTLSLGSGISPGLAARMRDGGEADPGAADRDYSVLAKNNGKSGGLPVYLVGTAPDADSGAESLFRFIGDVASRLAAGGSRPAGIFYYPLLDQFDPERGLSGGDGLLRVDFRDPDRRREIRRFARDLARIVKNGKANGRKET